MFITYQKYFDDSGAVITADYGYAEHLKDAITHLIEATRPSQNVISAFIQDDRGNIVLEHKA